jgi:hypothetical protein
MATRVMCKGLNSDMATWYKICQQYKQARPPGNTQRQLSLSLSQPGGSRGGPKIIRIRVSQTLQKIHTSSDQNKMPQTKYMSQSMLFTLQKMEA